VLRCMEIRTGRALISVTAVTGGMGQPTSGPLAAFRASARSPQIAPLPFYPSLCLSLMAVFQIDRHSD
jgi:hypothetical protein